MTVLWRAVEGRFDGSVPRCCQLIGSSTLGSANNSSSSSDLVRAPSLAGSTFPVAAKLRLIRWSTGHCGQGSIWLRVERCERVPKLRPRRALGKATYVDSMQSNPLRELSRDEASFRGMNSTTRVCAPRF
ncbi:hypothetical protein VTI28DRAFT_9017 [Corynascus sepedonium]